MRLENRIALVTGAGRGIGRAIALALAREGADVAICSRTLGDLEQVASEIETTGRRCLYEVCDVTTPAECVGVVKAAIDRFGQIDVLVNNAGGGDTADHRTIVETDDESLHQNIALNLYGTWHFTKAVLPGMIARRYGRIVNMSSVAGLQGIARLGAYVAAKHAVLGLSRTVALEYGAFGITCNAICPGPVRSGWSTSATGAGRLAASMDMSLEQYTEYIVRSRTAIRRMIEPEEVAELAVHLAAESSGSTTGQAISVCGGMNMH